jgi:sterol desaturase/sphingolipid hydroxylase (fatty acid hydroxylase superfamily)
MGAKLHDEMADISMLPEAERKAARAAHGAYIAAHLRPAEWSEVGPDLFFVGVNAVVALFCVAVYASGAMPAIARCGELRADWVAQVFLCNWVIMLCGYEGYHWVFHAGGFAWLFGGAKPTKFNPEAYEPGQLARERLFTTLSMGIASLYQCLALHGWARGWFPLTYLTYSAVPLWQFCATFLLLGLWSDFHFYWCHRLLHTDLLYAPFHKLHHGSKNPGPWSGMSMHPVETTLYLSKILGALFIPAHPLHFLFILYNATLMPIPGHSGHLELLGNEYHWLVSLRKKNHPICGTHLRSSLHIRTTHSPYPTLRTPLNDHSTTTYTAITMAALQCRWTSSLAPTFSSSTQAAPVKKRQRRRSR